MIPGEFKKGDRLTADGLNRLVREIVSRTLSAGPGIRINRTPSGSTISATGHSARAAAARPRPWDTVAVPGGDGAFDIYIYTAPVVGPDGAKMPYDPDAEGYSDLAPVDAQATENGPGGAPRFSLAAGEASDGWLLVEANEDFTAWRLALDPDRSGTANAVPVADIMVSGGALTSARGLHSGAVVLAHGDDGHWGDAKPLTELPADADGSWEARKNPTEGETASAVAESSLIELELDEEGRVSAKRYRTRTFDTHGNLIAISDRTESATPDPGGEEEPDPCGNPLNEGSEATDDDWDNPLEGGGGGGENEAAHDHPPEWDNPLDSEGEGGYTPACKRN